MLVVMWATLVPRSWPPPIRTVQTWRSSWIAMRSFGYADYHEMLAKEQIDIVVPILPVRPNP
jgi:hypothetical protein